MASRNKNFIILPKSWSAHGRTDRTGSAGAVQKHIISFRGDSPDPQQYNGCGFHSDPSVPHYFFSLRRPCMGANKREFSAPKW